MANQLEQDLKLIFDAGKKCLEEHPDDDSYDNVHFERALNNVSPEFSKAITESRKPFYVKEAERYINQCHSDIGFIGSPQYDEAKKIIERYEERVRKEPTEKEQLEKVFEQNIDKWQNEEPVEKKEKSDNELIAEFIMIKKHSVIPDDFVVDGVLNRDRYIIEAGVAKENYWRDEYSSSAVSVEMIGAVVIGSTSYNDFRYRERTAKDAPYDLSKSKESLLIENSLGYNSNKEK